MRSDPIRRGRKRARSADKATTGQLEKRLLFPRQLITLEIDINGAARPAKVVCDGDPLATV